MFSRLNILVSLFAGIVILGNSLLFADGASATLSGNPTKTTNSEKSTIGTPFPVAVSPPVSRSDTAPANVPAVEPDTTKGLSENPLDLAKELVQNGNALTSEGGITNTLKMFLTLTILSIVPAIALMTTSFVRIITVLSILRQALGTGQLPPNQVLTALSVFMTLLIMMPVWSDMYDHAIVPYSQKKITMEEAMKKGSAPLRTFMVHQLERTGNTNDIWLFMKYVPNAKTPEYYDEVPWRVLLPAFMTSELKTAFLIGFQLLLPFVIIDMVVAAVMVSMGMMMLPPAVVSLPFKLMLFVLMDGWTLVVKMLFDSFAWYNGVS